jgi:hypothetical protein
MIIHVSSPRPSPSWWPDFLRRIKQELETEPWMVREYDLDAYLPAKNTGDPSVIEFGLEWMQTCQKQHIWCESMDETRQAGYYPRRLVDLGTPEPQILRQVTARYDPPMQDERLPL